MVWIHIMSLAFIKALSRHGRRLFTRQDALQIVKQIGLSASYTGSLLHRLTLLKAIRPIARGHYALSNDLLTGSPLTLPEVAMHFSPKGALAYGSAMVEHGLSDQNMTRMFVLTPDLPSMQIRAEGHQLCFLPEKELWGTETRFREEVAFKVTTFERTLLDGLKRPQYCGGFLEVIHAYEQAAPRIRIEKILEILPRYPRVVEKRIGWIFEKLGIAWENVSLSELEETTFDRLDPLGKRRGSYNARWRLIENL